LNEDGVAPAVGPRDARQPRVLEQSVGSFRNVQLIVLVANTLLAVFFAVVQEKPFPRSLVYTQVIGNLMFWLNWGLHRLQGLTTISWRTSALAILLGGLLGLPAARLCELGKFDRRFLDVGVLFPAFVGALVSGGIVVYYFHARATVAEGRARLRDELLQRAEHERQLTQTELKLLQAQIEPHFLFNTLSNVLQLVDADPPAAKRMLWNLTSYLRASLHRTRAGATTLGEELDLVRAYLEIQAERMGARLAWRIDCPAELRDLPLPPLLLQPLVENAVRHGLEPSRGGGEVRVRAGREGETLVLEVQDTGVGIGIGSGSGVGLANVRARVRAVSQGQGSMVIQPNVPRGLCVRIALPPGGAAGATPAAAGGAP
jgi:signal transduction histidine kinase